MGRKQKFSKNSLQELTKQASDLGIELDTSDNMSSMVHNFNPFLQNYYIMWLQVESNKEIIVNNLDSASEKISALYDWIESFMFEQEKTEFSDQLKQYYNNRLLYKDRRELLIRQNKPVLKELWRILTRVMKKNGFFLPYTKYGL